MWLINWASSAIRMKTEFDSSIPKIELVRSDIGKVLLNVLNNAFYACGERSRGTGTSSFEVHHSIFDIQNSPRVAVTTKNLGDKPELSESATRIFLWGGWGREKRRRRFSLPQPY